MLYQYVFMSKHSILKILLVFAFDELREAIRFSDAQNLSFYLSIFLVCFWTEFLKNVSGFSRDLQMDSRRWGNSWTDYN